MRAYYRRPSLFAFSEDLFAEVPFPETMPAYQDLLVDAAGHLWVQEYQLPGAQRPRWTVFNRDGEMLGEVETPPRFRIFRVGSDFVLGRWLDDVDVPHVQLYQLLKESGAT